MKPSGQLPPGVTLGGSRVAGSEEILTPDALEFLAQLHRSFDPVRTALLERRIERQAEIDGGATLGPAARDRRDPRRSPLAGRRGAAGPPRPARRDHRAGRAEDDHQRPQLGRPGVHGGLRGLALADVGERGRRAGRAPRRGPRDARLHVTGGQVVPPRRSAGDAARPATRLAPSGAPPPGRRRADLRLACSTSGCTRSTTPASGCAAAAGCTSTSRSSSRTARRDSGTTCSSRRRRRSAIPRGTVRATVLIETIHAAFEMEEILYELREHSSGLNAGRWDYLFSCIKTFRGPVGAGPAGPRPGDDDRAVHARLHGAARPDLPPPRRARDGRDGRVHPVPPRRGGQRDGDGARSATTSSASRAMASTARGSPIRTSCRWRPRSSTASSASGRTSATGGSTRRRSAPRCRATRRRCSTCASMAAGDRGGRPAERLRRAAVPRRLAPRQRRRGDQQPHGGRGHGRDLALAAVAVARRPARRSTTGGR